MIQGLSKKDIANLLKDARARSGMTTEEVTRALGADGFEIVPKSMYNYESGTSSPPVPMFLALCRIYGIEDIEAAIKGGYERKIAVNAQEEYLIECFRKASPEVQDAALRVLQPGEKESTALSVG